MPLNGDDLFSNPSDSGGGWGSGGGGYGWGGGGPIDSQGNPWNSGSQGFPQDDPIGGTYIGGLYGSLYNPTQEQMDSMNAGYVDPNSFWGQEGNIGGGGGAGDPSADPGNGGETYSDILPGGWGDVGSSGSEANYGGGGSGGPGDTNGLDLNSDLYSQGDMGSAPGYGADSNVGGLAGNVWDLLNSRYGKLGQGLLSMAFPGLAIPMMAGRIGLGLASGHGGEAVGGTLGGIAQGALGLPGMALGMMGMGPSAMGAGLGRSFDQGTGMFGDNGGGMQGGAPGFMGGGYGGGGGGGFGGNIDPTTLAAGLGSMYLGNRAMSGINSQIGNLNSLYAPNSPYAQQMAQALERQDAASGRRSQYGTRAVELQAALANAASRNAPMLSNLYQQQRMARFGQLASLFNMGRSFFQQPGPQYDNSQAGLDQAIGSSQDDLNSIFDGG